MEARHVRGFSVKLYANIQHNSTALMVCPSQGHCPFLES